MKDRERKKVGKLGEEEALRFLVGAGQTVLDQNWRGGHYEIDIVTLDPKGIHFVEVKTRRPPLQTLPQESVGLWKQKKLVSAASRYLREKDGGRWADAELWFDVVTVVFAQDGVRTEYIPQAFIPLFV